jgi:hypothetical protein
MEPFKWKSSQTADMVFPKRWNRSNGFSKKSDKIAVERIRAFLA